MIIAHSVLKAALMADRPKAAKASQLYADLGDAWDTPRRWQIIREYYRIRHDDIMDRGADPYELGLERFWTPIEFQVWQDVRGLGLPFYMQYPVGRRFVDFGDPVRNIAIEADGARWHDPAKDAIKDAELKAAGWWVIRIKGRDTYGILGTNLIRELAHYYGIHCDPIQGEEEAW